MPATPLRIDVRARTHVYPVHVAAGLTARLGPLVGQASKLARPFIVSSPTVWKLHGSKIRPALPTADVVLIPDGERAKRLSTVEKIYAQLIQAGADRRAVLVAVGGGVVGDVAGFAAATYLRGIRLVHVPTTLLAQVDSAIGGKVGVNHQLGKNLIGAFHPPIAVLVDPALLATLPRRELRAGLYEVVKYGVIASGRLFARLEQTVEAALAQDPEALVPLIVESCRIKASVVAADELEGGRRRTLNFGHTAGHAIEAVTRYRRFRHGEAVAYGMLVAADLAVERRMLARRARAALATLIARMGPLPPLSDLSAKATLHAMQRDKKMVGGRLHFVLPTAIGRTSIVSDVPADRLARALRAQGMRA